MSVEDDIAFLKRAPLLRLLGDGALRIIAISTESRYVHEGEVLYREGEAAEAAFVVQDGRFAMSRAETAKAVEAGPSDILSEMALLIETTHGETATAAEPSTVIRIPRSMFRRMLEGYPEAARRLRDHFSEQTSQLADDILNVQYKLREGER